MIFIRKDNQIISNTDYYSSPPITVLKLVYDGLFTQMQS